LQPNNGIKDRGGKTVGRLIIVAGASGAGKTFFMNCWEKYDNNTQIIKKFVSEARAPREKEILTGDTDLIFSSKYDPDSTHDAAWYNRNSGVTASGKLHFHNRKLGFNTLSTNPFVYTYANAFYEINHEALERAWREDKNPIIVVRDFKAVSYLLKHYSDALLIYVQSILSGEEQRNALRKLNEEDIDINIRMERTTKDLNEFVNHMGTLPAFRIVLNNFDEREDGIIFKQIADIHQRHVSSLTPRSKKIFVIQSYHDLNEAVDVENTIIAAFYKIFRQYPEIFVAKERTGETFSIPEHVEENIRQSDCVVCDITSDRCNDCNNIEKRISQGTSPNVWYELGLAKQNHKKIILICKHTDDYKEKHKDIDIPIDLSGKNVIFYATHHELREKLKEAIKAIFPQ
jgi:guanylate kinase